MYDEDPPEYHYPVTVCDGNKEALIICACENPNCYKFITEYAR